MENLYIYTSKVQKGVCVCLCVLYREVGLGGNACQDTLDFKANVSDGWKDE